MPYNNRVFPHVPMKKNLCVFSCALLLSACTGTAATHDLYDNPLYAEWYYQDLVDEMVELVLREDEITKDERKMNIIEDTRRDALQKQKDAERRQYEGIMGQFISDIETTRGEALLLDDTLYLGPDFDTVPGPDLHLYLTTAVDPRDSFPDETAIDLGELRDAYGAQAYAVPMSEGEERPQWRTLVLWDEQLERLYGFAQLQVR